MKPGLAIGQTTTIETNVSWDMIVRYEGKTVHELYSTSALVHHMELSARKLIWPYLEETEECMGCHVDVSHLAMTLPDMKVTIVSTIADIRDNKVVVDVEASNIRGKIARGTVTHAVIDKAWLTNRMKEISVIQNIAATELAASNSR
jgi:fluoroacetyl-CoA thioesterase